MTKLFRTFFPKRISQDELDFLKVLTITGYMLTHDTYKNDARSHEMNTALMAIWKRRTAGVEGLSE